MIVQLLLLLLLLPSSYRLHASVVDGNNYKTYQEGICPRMNAAEGGPVDRVRESWTSVG